MSFQRRVSLTRSSFVRYYISTVVVGGFQMYGRSISIFVLASLCLSGCASVPRGEVRYFLPKTDASLTVTRTVRCFSGDRPTVSNVIVEKVEHRADPDAVRWIDLKSFDGALADGTATLEFYNDGTLKGVNSKSVGKGSAVVQSAVKLAGLLLPGPGLAVGRPLPPAEFCAELRAITGETDPAKAVVVLQYRHDLDLAGPSGHVALVEPDGNSRLVAERLQDNLGEICVSISHSAPTAIPYRDKGRPWSGSSLALREPGRALVTLHAGPQPPGEGSVVARRSGRPPLLRRKPGPITSCRYPVSHPLEARSSSSRWTRQVRLLSWATDGQTRRPP